MNVLIACEESQRVCMAFRAKGHNAYSCDIQPCSGGHPEWHIEGDVLPLLNGAGDDYGRVMFCTADGKSHMLPQRWDMIIAHPPCTFMSKAGARWMYPTAGVVDEERMKKAMKAKAFFESCLNADCEKIAVENPIPLKIVELPKPTQIIQPYQFGHPYIKTTLLWLKGLKPLKPTKIVDTYRPYVPSNTGKHSRGAGGSKGVAHNAKTRSETFEGVALAMAEQWG